MSEAVLRFESQTNEDFEAREDRQVFEIESRLLQGIFGCRSTEAVEASITYARYLSSVGITPENYPVFLKMLEVANHWVIDALNDPSLRVRTQAFQGLGTVLRALFPYRRLDLPTTGYSPGAPAARRKEGAARIQAWWQRNGG